MKTNEAKRLRLSATHDAIMRLPRRLRPVIIESNDHASEGGMSPLMMIEFTESGARFNRSTLFLAIRKLITRRAGSKMLVADLSGVTHEFTKIDDDGRPSAGLVTTKSAVRPVWYLGLLHLSARARLEVLKFHSKQVSLPEPVVAGWSKILRKRPLRDDEYVLVQNDFADAPLAVAELAQRAIYTGSFDLRALIPRSERYWDWLVGAPEPGEVIEAFIKRSLLPQIRAHLRKEGIEGAKRAVLLGLRVDISLGLTAAPAKTFEALCEWLIVGGDPFSCVAALEAGIVRLGTSQKHKDLLARLAERLLVQIKGQKQNQIPLLSALMISVMGEMSRRRTHADRPPYWRRLAAFTHANMLARCFPVDAKLPVAIFRQIEEDKLEHVTVQNLADMRLEPRWWSEYIAPDQLKNELGSRVVILAEVHAAAVEKAGLKDVLYGAGAGAIRSALDPQRVYLPGPLEGVSKSPIGVKPALRAKFNRELKAGTITSETLTMITANSRVFDIPPETLDLLAKAIERDQFALTCLDLDKTPVFDIFWLANTAAIYRHKALAEAVFGLLRGYAITHAKPLRPVEIFISALVAAASYEALPEWTERVGRAVTNIAFGSLTAEDAAMVDRYLRYLCHVAPELWHSCGQAIAALQAVKSA